MKLLLVRHGEAEAGPVDAERALTALGRADIARVARIIEATGWNVAEIVSSPLRRTVESGRILSETLSAHPALRSDGALAPGVSTEPILRLLEGVPPSDAIVWVFHAPDVQRVASLMTGLPDSGFYFTPGTVVALNLPLPRPVGKSLIVFALPPEFVRSFVPD